MIAYVDPAGLIGLSYTLPLPARSIAIADGHDDSVRAAVAYWCTPTDDGRWRMRLPFWGAPGFDRLTAWRQEIIADCIAERAAYLQRIQVEALT